MNIIDIYRQARRGARLWPVAVLMTFAAAVSAEVIEGRTADGRRYVAGGIGVEEVDAMRNDASAFSLQLVTAARSGAYLAGTHVRILGAANAVVLDTRIEGPWLLVDLPGGRYTVLATHSGTTVERRLTIAPGKPQRVVLHFDAPVDQEGPAQVPDTARTRMPQ